MDLGVIRNRVYNPYNTAYSEGESIYTTTSNGMEYIVYTGTIIYGPAFESAAR
jgi:hypothetical protein